MTMSDSAENAKEYFVGHSLTPENVKDLRRVIAGVFSPRGYVPYYADKSLQVQSLLFKISQKIYLADFSVFDLSLPNPNVYLELGIALSFNRPTLLMARNNADLPGFLTPDIVMRYTDYADIEAQLSLRCEQGFPNSSGGGETFCLLCGRSCPGLSTEGIEEEFYLIADAAPILWRDVMGSLTKTFSGKGIVPRRSADLSYGARLCDIRRLVQSARFCVVHLGDLADEVSYLMLGLMIGMHEPWLLLAKDSDEVPSNLKGIDRICYSTYTDLEEQLTTALNGPLRIDLLPPMAQTDSPINKTQEIELSFWTQLEHWIARVAPRHVEDTTVQNGLRLVRYQGIHCLAERPISSRGLVVGRGPTCDIQIDDPAVSTEHFRVWMDKRRRYILKDPGSTNGTYLNGERLPSGLVRQIFKADRIHILNGRFVVWDDGGLPLSSPPLPQTGYLGLPIQIDILGILPPPHLSFWDNKVTLKFIHPDGRNIIADTQSYYSFGAILEELYLQHHLGLPSQNYRLKRFERYIDSDETPLSLGLLDGAVLQIEVIEQSNYQLGLEQLKKYISTTAFHLMKDFYPLEQRLQENLSRERKYGSDETVRKERAEIVDELNRLAERAHSQHSFNDLCRVS
jgi:hypothetical protein